MSNPSRVFCLSSVILFGLVWSPRANCIASALNLMLLFVEPLLFFIKSFSKLFTVLINSALVVFSVISFMMPMQSAFRPTAFRRRFFQLFLFVIDCFVFSEFYILGSSSKRCRSEFVQPFWQVSARLALSWSTTWFYDFHKVAVAN